MGEEMKQLILILLCIEIGFPWEARSKTFSDIATPSHLAIMSSNMCFPATITQINQCWQRTGLCKNQDMLCYVMTSTGRPALVCNVVNGQQYVFCE